VARRQMLEALAATCEEILANPDFRAQQHAYGAFLRDVEALLARTERELDESE
jgi:hypothetical protein